MRSRGPIDDFSRQLSSVVAQLRRRTPLRPQLGIVLGSGFTAASSALKIDAEVPFSSLPGLARPGVGGHAGLVQFGHFGPTPTCVVSGRLHYYEGHELSTVTLLVRVLAAFGIWDLLLTNAAGGIRRSLRPGSFMRITDHINAMGANPLRGIVGPGGERFVDLTQAYDPGLGRLLERAAKRTRLPLQRGVYLAVSGPSYETPAEIRAFRTIGADAVGMSTVPEVIAARQCGLRVAGLSCITNVAAGLGNPSLSHADVLATGERVGDRAAALVDQFARMYAERA